MDALPRVHDSVRRIAQYATHNADYDPPILFLDDEAVTAEQIKQKLTASVLLGRPRIMIYFCGHGAFLNGKEIWYLSDGKAQWSQRVLVPEFRDILATYGPKQIGFFSDACQTAEYADATGSPILDAYSGAPTTPRVDIFRATIRGQPAYSTPADGPLFSKVIAEVLTDFPPESALDKQYLLNGERVVSSQSLGTYVEDHLPDYAALDAGKWQKPEINSGFRYDTNDYLKFAQPPKISTGSPPSTRIATERESEKHVTALHRDARPRIDLDTRLRQALDASQSEWRQAFWDRTDRLLPREGPRPNIVVTIAGAGHHDTEALADTVKLVVPEPDHRFWQISISQDTPAMLISIDKYRAAFEGGEPFAALLSVNGLHIALELQKDPETIVLDLSLGHPYGGNVPGVGALGWNDRRSRDMGSLYRPMEVLKGLMSGALTADLVQPLAAQLRVFKHTDPLYGIAAAYLYDRIGDVDGIRRMCLYYAKHNQGIPFDIALLSRLQFDWKTGRSGFRISVPDIPEDADAHENRLPMFAWEKMQGREALPVAGFAPVLQAGWGRLATLRPHPMFEDFLWLQRHLTDAPFTTFEGDDAYKGLLALFNVAGSRYEQESPYEEEST
ncbi:hypothetical protein [Bradyrhizobium sp.]